MSTAIVPQDNATERPELWTPTDVAARFRDVLESVQSKVTAFSDPHWLDNLPGLLTGHLRLAIAARDYDGKQPGTYPKPDTGLRTVMKPIPSPTGPTRFMRSLQPMDEEDFTPEDREAWKLYRWSEQHHVEFTEKVSTARDAILADPGRAWAAHLHLLAIDSARRTVIAEHKAVEAERLRLSVQQCPLCKASDAARIGPVRTRALLDWTPTYVDRVRNIRSCLACWSIASERYIDSLGGELVDGERTRSEVIGEALQLQDPAPRFRGLGRMLSR